MNWFKMNWFKNKHQVFVGSDKSFNLEDLCNKGKFDVHINGSIERSYEKLCDYSKSQKANIAVVEERNTNSMKGTLYSAPGNPFCSIQGRFSLDSTNSGYALVKNY